MKEDKYEKKEDSLKKEDKMKKRRQFEKEDYKKRCYENEGKM